MKQCWQCGTTKGLKQMCYDICSDEFLEGRETGCTCRGCYLMLHCGYEHGDIEDCIKIGSFCPDSKMHKERYENWDKLDYHYEPKKGVVLTV